MSKIKKTIENPEVPGLECLLPLPPSSLSGPKNPDDSEKKQTPTDAMPKKSTDVVIVENSVKTEIDFTNAEQNKSDSVATNVESNDNVARPFAMPGIPVFPETVQGPYFAIPPVKPLPGIEQPWWVPTESDTAEFVPQNTPWIDANASWMDPNQKSIPPSGKAKSKFLKRKSECIDPAEDAERVANAQRELSALMKPMKCDLCNAIMNSTLQAKLHYDGKPHQKKVSMFLNQSVKKLKPDDVQVTSTTTSNNDWNTSCEVCKTWFTSEIDANQHYAGKKHIRATTGAAKQKTKKPQAVQAPVDPTGRFGIGVPFTSPITVLAPILGTVDRPLIPQIPSPVASPNPTWPLLTYRCELCGVTANRPDQLETHKRGARHIRMMKMSGLSNSDDDETNESATPVAPSSIDYSICRTPSGQYYCAPCNRSFQSENSFAQHIDSKKHKTQVNPKPPAPASPLATSKKPNKAAK